MTETEIYNYIVDQLVPSDVTIDNDIGIVRSYILYIVENNLKDLLIQLKHNYNIEDIEIKFTNHDEVTLFMPRSIYLNKEIMEDIRLLINYNTGFDKKIKSSMLFLYYMIKDKKIEDLYNKLIKTFKEKLNKINPPQNTIVDGWDAIIDKVKSNL